MRCFLFGAILGSLALLAPCHGQTATRPPNILFIAVDDLNDWIGCLGGHPQSLTPNMDRLAASGVLFRNAYTAAPACNPSRSAIFTGRAPADSGLYDNLQKLRDVMPDEVLMPRHFSNHGYWSAGSGKMLHYVIDPVSWDDYFPAKETDDPFPPTYEPKKRPVSLPRGGPWQYAETDWAALDVDDKTYGGDYSVSGWIGDQLRKTHDRPFFLACGIYRPHEPWFVPARYYEPFPLESVQLPPGYLPGDLDDVPQMGRRIGRNRYFPHILWHGQWRNGVQAYLASIHFADAMIGRVLDALKNGPNADNTIVVLWSDHGWQLGEKEHWQKFTAWRACARVPLMVRVPTGCPGLPDGTKPGSICDRPVGLIDLFPTLTELTGIPAKPNTTGRSIVPLLKTPDSEWNHPAITHLGHPDNYAISLQRWRYIHYRDGSEELYDIAKDPYEWTNRAKHPESEAMLRKFRALAPKDPKPFHGDDIADFEAQDTVAPTPLGDAKPPATVPGGKPVKILFLNKSQFGITVTPIDAMGEPQPSFPMKGATQKLIDTHTGMVWTFQDEKGNKLGYFRAGEAPVRLIIE